MESGMPQPHFSGGWWQWEACSTSPWGFSPAGGPQAVCHPVSSLAAHQCLWGALGPILLAPERFVCALCQMEGAEPPCSPG